MAESKAQRTVEHMAWRILPSINGQDFWARNDKTGEHLDIVHYPTLDNSPRSISGAKKGYMIRSSFGTVGQIAPDAGGGDRVEFKENTNWRDSLHLSDLDLLHIASSVRNLE